MKRLLKCLAVLYIFTLVGFGVMLCTVDPLSAFQGKFLVIFAIGTLLPVVAFLVYSALEIIDHV